MKIRVTNDEVATEIKKKVYTITDALIDSGLVKSRAEAKRLIKQGAISVLTPIEKIRYPLCHTYHEK